jgi:CRISPR-associated endonuclease/helicase Cas3
MMFRVADFSNNLTYWAKTSNGKPNGDVEATVVQHSVDACNAMEALWMTMMTPRCRKNLSGQLQQDEIQTKQLLLYLAGMHDVGKMHPDFQSKLAVENSYYSLIPGHSLLQKAGHARIPHAYHSEQILRNLARDSTVKHLAAAIGWHHGRRKPINRNQRRYRIDSPWKPDIDDWTSFLQQNLQVVWPREFPDTAQAYIGGLIVLADWLASSKPREDAQSYSAFLRREQLGFDFQVPQEKDILDAVLKENANTPRKAQEVVWDMINNSQLGTNKNNQFLLIIESQTGSGKTEAAQIAGLHGITQLGHRGVFVGLPTKVTATKAWERYRELYLELGGKKDPMLAHSGATLDLFAQYDRNNQEPPYSWFQRAGKTMFAPWSIGTIDQALVGILRTKHFLPRLTALSNKVVILDEVHAYDDFTSRHIHKLIQWLRSLGCSVVILSATLPTAMRDKITYAWEHPEDNLLQYPITTSTVPLGTAGFITSSLSTSPNSICLTKKHILKPDSRKRAITIKLHPQVEESAGTNLIQLVREHLYSKSLVNISERGPRIVVVANTTKEAYLAYLECRNAFPQYKTFLITGRQRPIERESQTQEALKFFSKSSQEQKPVFLVGTQAIEQSLDFDGDVMYSMLAPIDSLVQRAGRLWRHQIDNRSVVAGNKPVLHILHASQEQYENDKSFVRPYQSKEILIRTLEVLRNLKNELLHDPDDIAHFVDEVYQTDEDTTQLQEAAAVQIQAPSTGQIGQLLLNSELMNEASTRRFHPQQACLILNVIPKKINQEPDRNREPDEWLYWRLQQVEKPAKKEKNACYQMIAERTINLPIYFDVVKAEPLACAGWFNQQFSELLAVAVGENVILDEETGFVSS